MPINWLIIFLLCLMSLFIIMMMMNSLLLYIKMKKIMFNHMYNKNIYKKWKWLW
nr:TPA_asm: ATP8 [Bombus lepidus]